MGNLAEAMADFVQPLIEATDGSPEELQKAYSLGQLCWNVARTPKDLRDEFLTSVQPSLNMDESEFQDFKENVVMPMIHRHEEMFPAARRNGVATLPNGVPNQNIPNAASRLPNKKFPGTGRNERCPCGSGKKYKFCCIQ